MQTFLETVGLSTPETGTTMTTTTTTSQIRQNFHDDSINGINKLINMYWHGNYSCMSLWQHFTRDDVALSNIACYFEKVGKIKCWKAKQLMCYMNIRGGRVTINDIQAPKKLDWSSALEAFESTLEFEKNVNKELLTLHSIALKNNDYQLQNFLETEFLCDMVKYIEELGWIITNLRRVGKGIGEFVFDEQYFSNPEKIHTFTLLTEKMKNLRLND